MSVHVDSGLRRHQLVSMRQSLQKCGEAAKAFPEWLRWYWYWKLEEKASITSDCVAEVQKLPPFNNNYTDST